VVSISASMVSDKEEKRIENHVNWEILSELTTKKTTYQL